MQDVVEVINRISDLAIRADFGGLSEWRWCDGHSRSVQTVDDDEGGGDVDSDDDWDYESGFCEFQRPGNTPVIHLCLLSHRQRFAAQLWPAAKLLAWYLHARPEAVLGQTVLELGAGAALPSLCAALIGARSVLVTDFPDARMLGNVERNLNANLPPLVRRRVQACGYNWSHPATALLDALRTPRGAIDEPAAPASGGEGAAVAEAPGRLFDVVLMSDLLYELEHEALLSAAAMCLGAQPHARVLLTFQPHDPVQLSRQLRFFEIAPRYGLFPRLLRTEVAPKMFDDACDAEDEEGMAEGEHAAPGSACTDAKGLPEVPHAQQHARVLCRRVYLYALSTRPDDAFLTVP